MENLKKRIKILTFYIPLLLLMLINYACFFSNDDNSGDCEDVVELADLAVSILDLLNDEIIQSTEVTITNQIINEGLPNVCDVLSETAPESTYALDFSYRKNSNSPWLESAATAYISVDELVANATANKNFSFIFQQAGEYKINGLSDVNNNVIERNEKNNGKEFTQLNNNGIKSKIIVVKHSVLKNYKETDLIIKPVSNKNKSLVNFESKKIKDIKQFYELK